MTKIDILVIGGGPGGVVAAVEARRINPAKNITLVRNRETAIIPCAIPYIFNRLDSAEKCIMPDKMIQSNKIDLLIDEAVSIDKDSKSVKLKSGNRIFYNKMILATGSTPATLPLKGIDLDGVWYIDKNLDHIKKLRKDVIGAKNIAIIGGGFIGVEIAEELNSIKDLNICIVEKLDHCLADAFDEEFSITVEEILSKNGIKINTGTTVDEISGKGKVEYVKLENGNKIPADIIIIAVGAKPNTGLIKETGIKTGDYKGILVDKEMRTNNPDIFAVGDCTEPVNFFTGKNNPRLLASAATSEAVIAAENLYKKESSSKRKGVFPAFSTCIDGLVLGGTGITENQARKDNLEITVGRSECPNHHPGFLPNTGKITAKLIFSSESGLLLGAQIMGPESISEMINILTFGIQMGANVHDFIRMNISTHPLLTSPPTAYPLIVAAQMALSRMKNGK